MSGNITQGNPRNELTGYDDTLEFVGALADHQQRCVAIQPLHGKLGGIAVATMHTHRLSGVLQRRLGGKQLRHAGLHVAAVASVIQLRGASYRQREASVRVAMSASFNWIA